VRGIGRVLIAASSLFFLETSFEMYLLTLMNGPQMLFFSLAHIAPFFLLIVALSGVAFVCLAIFAFVVVMENLIGKLESPGNYPRFMLIVLCVQIVHTALLLTYERWAPTLFANGGI
jgi:hypothetical protein